MAHQLELSYNWRTPVAIVVTLAAVGCIAVLARGQVRGWITVLLLVVVHLGRCSLFVMVRRARSYLMVEDEVLVLRPWRAYVRVRGDQVRAVKQVLTARGPSYRLTVALPDGRTVRYLVPAAWLRGAHPVLFNWLLTYAPDAELDKGSRKTLELLRRRGVIADAQ